MNPDERDRMIGLCERIAQEKNPQKFTNLVKELNELLDGKVQRLDSPPKQN